METPDQVTMTKINAFQAYEDSMNEADKVAYKIAIQQLESSFDLEKSIGFLEYIKNQNIILVD